MKTTTALAVSGLAAVAAISAPAAALAHPGASHKPTGTIFFFREAPGGGSQNAYSMTAAGKSARKVPQVAADFSVYPAARAHRIVYTISTGQFERGMRVATYKGKVTHTYKPKNFIFVEAVSPNGKYIVDKLDHGTGRTTYDVATIKGKTIAKLFSIGESNPEVVESWSGNSKQVVVIKSSSGTPVKSSIKIYNLHGKLVRTLVKNAGASYNVAWSPKGTIAYSGGHDIKTMRPSGGHAHVLLNAGASFPDGGLSYSPNGAYLAYGLNLATNGEQIWRINANGSSPHEITSNGTQPNWG